jgi:hypothetical protein
MQLVSFRMQDRKELHNYGGISHGAREGKEDILFFSLRYLLFSFSLRLITKEDKREERG